MNLAIFEKGIYFDIQEPFCTDHFYVVYRDPSGVNALLTSQMSGEDLIVLAKIVKTSGIKAPEIVECGSWVGHTTCLLGLLAKESGGHVTAIDNFKGNPGTTLENLPFDVKLLLNRNIQKYGLTDTVTVVDGDSRSIKKECDIVFLDAGHTYHEIKADIDHWWECLRPGGTMCGHDFDASGWDERYIHEDYVDGIHHGVVKAVSESFKTRVKRYEGNSSMWYVKKPNNT